MQILLDTKTLLGWWLDDNSLSPEFKARIQDPNAKVFVSAASAFEVSIKRALGRIEFPVEEWADLLEESDFTSLPIKPEHAVATGNLPAYLNDPFDRVMVAQSQCEGISLLSEDKSVQQFFEHYH